MALLSNGHTCPPSLTTSTVTTTMVESSSRASDLQVDHLLSNLLESMTGPSTGSPPHPQTGRDYLISNMFQAFSKADDSVSGSPATTTSSVSLCCSKCDDRSPATRCLDCSEVYCLECTGIRSSECHMRDHTVVPVSQSSPLVAPPKNGDHKDPHCDFHNEIMRFYCETCAILVCQECTFWNHKDHTCIPISDAVSDCRLKIMQSLESGKMGTKCIKNSIDKAVAISKSVDREAVEATLKVKKAMRHYILAIEDRERFLLEKIEKMRQTKLAELSDQMNALRSALAGLAQTNDSLGKYLDMEGLELFVAKDKAVGQIEHFANMYKSLQPKDESFWFVPPNYGLLAELKKQGDVIVSSYSSSVLALAQKPLTSITYEVPSSSGVGLLSNNPSSVELPRPLRGRNFTYLENAASLGHLPAIGTMPDKRFQKGSGQCIPGSLHPVTVKPNRSPLPNMPVVCFGIEGHEDGQVSRPWGLCVDRDSNIIVADRRNNRIQIFDPNGHFKLKFGCKGTGPGEFDLPAGITTDPNGRIIVVDKDNHRVQIFTSMGLFILKFGTCGKENGQFQYPWDVAVNSIGNILITDSRNHRIQLFTSSGQFITKFIFELSMSFSNPLRVVKGPTTPRGACFTPLGDIIVSDFENHRLLLIDSGLTKIMSINGREGGEIGEFSRPSGILCDDEGRVVVADSKNHRIMIFSPTLEFLWSVDVRGLGIADEKDRPSDVALTPQGYLAVILETLPDAREGFNPGKTHIHVF